MTDAITVLRADNPSPMTHTGTNTYLVGEDQLIVIDPGPVLESHHQALIQAIGGRDVTHVIVTHAHLDHSPLARRLADEVDAPVLAFGPPETGRSAIMQDLAAQGLVGGGEGVDVDFAPDLCVADGARVENDELSLEVLHTPGHMGNHISLDLQGAVFSGDLIMGWASSLVSPPDGDLTDFMASCQRLRDREPRVLYPGHGDPVTDPKARISWLIEHRNARTAQILEALGQGGQTPADLTRQIYHDTPPALHPAAERNVLAHLVHLMEQGRVQAKPRLSATAQFILV